MSQGTENLRLQTVHYVVQLDSFTQQILNAFLGVLRRPRNGIEVGAISSEYDFVCRIPLRAYGEDFILVIWQGKNIKIDCHMKGTNELFSSGPFHFSATFRRATPQNVRKQALILCQKMKMKPYFDVMKA